MPLATRHLCLTVLLALLVGHASYVVHAASHDGVDAAECQLCISYGNSSAVLGDAPEQGVATPGQDDFARGYEGDVPSAHRGSPVRPRGPPPAD